MGKSSKEALGRFWSAERTFRLRGWLLRLKEAGACGVGDLANYTQDLTGEDDKQIVTRYIGGSTKRPTTYRVQSALLWWLAEHIDADDASATLTAEDITLIKRMCREYIKQDLRPRLKSSALPDWVKSKELEGPIAAFLELLRKHTDVDPAALKTGCRFFFNESEEYCRRDMSGSLDNHFLCYRYASEPSEVVKSFLYLKSASEFLPFARFGNFVPLRPGTKEPRKAEGMVFTFKKSLCFFGQIDRGSGVKLMVFDRPTTVQDLYQGLVITMDRNFNPLASRIVLKRIPLVTDGKAAAHVVVKAGTYRINGLTDTEQDEILPLLDNAVELDMPFGTTVNKRRAKIGDLLRAAEKGELAVKDETRIQQDGKAIDLPDLKLIGVSALKVSHK